VGSLSLGIKLPIFYRIARPGLGRKIKNHPHPKKKGQIKIKKNSEAYLFFHIIAICFFLQKVFLPKNKKHKKEARSRELSAPIYLKTH
jgi:hypothetical protein